MKSNWQLSDFKEEDETGIAELDCLSISNGGDESKQKPNIKNDARFGLQLGILAMGCVTGAKLRPRTKTKST